MSDVDTANDKNQQMSTAEESLRRSRERLVLALEGSGAALWDWQVQTGEVEFNERWARMVGYTLEELAPLSIDTWYDLAHPEDLKKSNRLLQRCFDGKLESYECEVRMRHKDGRWIWVLDRGQVVEWGRDGKPLRMAGTHLDITERKKAENALRESEKALRTIFDNTHDAIFIHAVDGKVLDVNRKMLELYRVTREQALRSSIAEDFSTPDNPLHRLEDWWHRVLQGESLTFEWMAKRPNDGSRFDVEVALKRITLGNRKVVLANVRDISIRKAAESVLKESEEKFRALVEHSIDAIMRFDRHRRLLYANPIAERQFRLPAEEISGKTCRELGIPEAICPLWEEAIDRVFESGQVQRLEIQLPGGRWTDWMLMPERDETGHACAVVASARDITDRKRAEEEREKLEEQLRHSQKMEAVGRLAGGVAHDFNNMLGVILGQTELAMAETAPDRPLHARLKEIQTAATRSADLARQLLVFARKQTVAPEVLDLNETVEGMLKMLRRLIGEHLDLVWLPGKDVCRVKVDPSQIDQILANLCVNARDAIESSGTLTIETKNAAFDEAGCAAHEDAAPGEYAVLAVSDDGTGMDEETLANLFEPFFTTKEVGRGSGLGLATVYGIVKQNRGFISVRSRVGRGTTFEIYLPGHRDGRVRPQDRKPAKPTDRGKETILLVEDEPANLELTRIMLEREGYTVLAAPTPTEAIRLAKEHAGRIHLLVTDVVMPGMNGRELAGRLLQSHPAMKSLYMSGYTADIIAHHGVLDEGVNFLQKPFLAGALAAKVREVLESS